MAEAAEYNKKQAFLRLRKWRDGNMFKIAYGAGHNRYTAGRRIPKELDTNETREWTLNDRVAQYFAEAAAQYEGVETLRVDDPLGEEEVDLAERCKTANGWGANFFLAIHHNAFRGTPWGGGGIVAYSFPGSDAGEMYRDAIYDACIAAGGLKGDRSAPKTTANFQVLRETYAPAVLMEYGFMDSRADAPVILSEAYAKLVACATMEGIAQAAGLQKKTQEAQPAKTVSVELPVLARGNGGYTVRVLQYLLTGNGYSLPGHGADGDFGAETEAAVQAYQRDNGLTVDGIVGAQTWGSLLGL